MQLYMQILKSFVVKNVLIYLSEALFQVTEPKYR